MPEFIMILVIALLVIGPKDLPEMAKKAGKWYGELRRMMRGLETSLSDLEKEATAESESIKKTVDERDDKVVKKPGESLSDPK